MKLESSKLHPSLPYHIIFRRRRVGLVGMWKILVFIHGVLVLGCIPGFDHHINFFFFASGGNGASTYTVSLILLSSNNASFPTD